MTNRIWIAAVAVFLAVQGFATSASAQGAALPASPPPPIRPASDWELMFQIGGEALNVSPSRDGDFDSTTTSQPFVAIGIVSKPVGFYIQAEAVDYKADSVGTTGGSAALKTHITGTSVAAILALWPANNVAVRLGAGQTSYHFAVTQSAAQIQALAALGANNPSISLDDAIGNFTLIGTDVYLAKNFFVGFEYRDTTLTTHGKFTATFAGVTSTTDLGNFNDGFNSIALRAGFEF